MQKPTIFQRLSNVLSSDTLQNIVPSAQQPQTQDDILLRTTDPDVFKQKSLEFRQAHHLAKQWHRAQLEINNNAIGGLNEVKMMYRDCDLMDTFPEIGAALDIVSEEATFIKGDGFMVNVTSKSQRVKAVLQDLLVNRLSIHTILPMICRSMCKYGNNFMLLNIDNQNGITGWKQLPVYDIERYENGMENPYSQSYININTIDIDKPDSTKFVWVGKNEYIPYMNWQIAHFRLLYDSLFLPYGCSYLHKARRHFRMLSMMEDMMLIYRLERSIERRVFKINVGAIDEADVPAYVQEIANNFKRTPIVDPLTGQLDLRKNLLNVSEDYFIPVRDDNAPNPIDTLQAAQNMTAMDDIKFVQNKIMTALRVPKSFLNFEDAQGDGKNLSLLDVRFTRTVNRIQQSLLMELNKVCIIHLYLLGFTDDLTNFTLKMNNPSSQAEMLELDNMAKKITTAKDAVTDGGNGMPIMSVTRAWKEILGWSEKEIEDNLEELRLEKALVAELEKTSQIIKRTKIFDPVDNIYGEVGAEYLEDQAMAAPGDDGGAGGGGMGGGITGGIGDMDFGDDVPPDTMGDEAQMGEEGEMSMADAAAEDTAGDVGAAPPMPNESLSRLLKNVINEQHEAQKYLMEGGKQYSKMLKEQRTKDQTKEENIIETIPLYNKNFFINEELDSISKELDKIVND